MAAFIRRILRCFNSYIAVGRGDTSATTVAPPGLRMAAMPLRWRITLMDELEMAGPPIPLANDNHDTFRAVRIPHQGKV